MATLVCHSSGCVNDGVPIELNLWTVDVDGNPTHVDEVWCGGCGNTITDVTNDDAPQG